MADQNSNFHEFALNSALFKGHRNWYFCFLKAEKLSHALAVLARERDEGSPLYELARTAARLPEGIARFAAGELALENVLADVFALAAGVRFAGVALLINGQNADVVVGEYERIAEKLALPGAPSPFLSAENFAVQEISASPKTTLKDIKDIKDTSRTFAPSHSAKKPQATNSGDRQAQILALIRSRGGASVKDIARIVKGIGEKTIQRELAVLIAEGLIYKEGERRWSIYRATNH